MVNTTLHLVKKDLIDSLAKVMSNDASLTPQEAMLKVTMEMLANNPYVPPKGCPVNDLPPELLAYIFKVGTQMEAEGGFSDDEDDEELADQFDLKDGWSSESDDMEVDGPSGKVKKSEQDKMETIQAEEDEEEEDDEDLVLPFQVLVSHVCRHWREIALESPALFTTLTFSEGPPFEKSRIWIERSKGLPLDIHIDFTIPDDEVAPFTPGDDDASAESTLPAIRAETHGQIYMAEHSECQHPPPALSLPDLGTILDILVPHIKQWRQLEVTCSVYDYMHLLLTRLSECPTAPLLEVLQLYHYEDCEDYETFGPRELATPFLIFNGEAPKLRDVALWGVHLDWDRSVSLLSGLRDFELAYHAKDVRPSWETFTKLISNSPDIRTLTLCLSGPAHGNDEDDWGSEPFEIPSLKDLVLCYHDQKYAIALVRKLSVPNVHSLTLDYDDEDHSDFAHCLTLPMPRKTKSLLAGLEHLKIAGLPCNDKTIDQIFEQLVGLKTLNLNCSREEEEKYFLRLLKSSSGGAGSKLYCPNLQTITTSGIQGSQMKTFITNRKAAGVPIKRVLMSEEDDVDEQQEQWMRTNVEEFEFFEPSDSEEEFVDEDEDDVDIDDETDGD